MPRFQPVQILGGCYADSDRAWSLQDVVNWLPEQAEQPETRTPIQFKTPPGLRPYLEIPGTVVPPSGEIPGYTIPSKPVRGTYNCEGKLFAAIGKTLYQVTNSGVAIPQGTIPGNTRVTMTHNQISQGNELVAVNGSSGYVYNTLTQVYEKITDEGFPGAIWVGFADGYILGIEPGRRFAFNSDPADAKSYNTLDRFTSEYKPDLIVTGIVNNNELILLNETSFEFFENTGATQQPFRSKRIYGDVGCASRYGACNLDRTVFMFGADGKFYRLEGYSWQRISTRPIEQAVRGLNWSQAFCFTWDDGGHSVVYWTFPDGLTWGFDQSTQLWHRRKSLGLDRWRPNTSTQLGQNWYMGDFQTGRIWVMDWDYILEGDDEIESERVTGVLSDNQNLLQVNRVELLFNTGQELTVPVEFPVQPEPPSITAVLPNGNVDEPWPGGTYVATGGTPPYSYSSRPGTIFPGNLGPMSGAGVVPAETPTTQGNGVNIARVTDSKGLFAEVTDPFVIGGVLIGLEWQYTGTFGNNINDVCWGITSADEELFLACGSGIAANGEIWTSADTDTWLQRTDGSSNSLRSCAYGRPGDAPLFVVSRDSAFVLTSPDCVTWTTHATVDGDAYLVTLWDGDFFIRLGFNTSAERSATGVGGWSSVARPTSSTCRVAVTFEHNGDKVVLAMCSNGAIHRTIDSGSNWTNITVPGDPASSSAFTGATANADGSIVRAYKYASSILTTYTSLDGGVTWTWQQDNIGSANYQAGPLLFRNGTWFGLGAAVAGFQQIQLWYSPDGLPPWSPAVVHDYDDTESAVMYAITSNPDSRAVLVGTKGAGNAGFAMTSPVLTP